MTPSDGKAGFARRLNQAFDRLDIPAKQRGRFTAIGRLFSVSPVAARDWCEGNSYPSVDKLLLIMDTVRCGADWLLFGRQGEGGATDSAALPTGSAPAPAAADAGGRANHDGRGETDSRLRWITVTGDSMAPTLQAGDAAGIAPLADSVWHDGVYALTAMTAWPGSTAHATPGPALPEGGSADPPAPAPVLRRALLRLDGVLALGCDHPGITAVELFRRIDATCWQSLAADGRQLQVLGRVVARRHAL